MGSKVIESGCIFTRGTPQPPTWQDHLVAALAAVAILSGATLAAHYLAVVAGAEGLGGQRLGALGTAEAVLVPVAVLMVQLLNTEGTPVLSSHARPH